MNDKMPPSPELPQLDWEKINRLREEFREGMRRSWEKGEQQKRLNEELFRLLGLPRRDREK